MRRRRSLLVEAIVDAMKGKMFTFELLPGDRFTETEVARWMNASRTPVREALYRLQREGFVEVRFRSGWQVREFDFTVFEQLYDLRTVLEVTAIERICGRHDKAELLQELQQIWQVDPEAYATEPTVVADLDEQFHADLVAAMENAEIDAVFNGVTERIRIIRRLDFLLPDRIAATYQEHARILSMLTDGRVNEAVQTTRLHIDNSKLSVKNITLHRLHEARNSRSE